MLSRAPAALVRREMLMMLVDDRRLSKRRTAL
jgi:hypothetical protein